MSIVTHAQLAEYLRQAESDPDYIVRFALSAALSEASAIIGADIEIENVQLGSPSDFQTAVRLLASVHADSDEYEYNEYRRAAAHGLLRPYRRLVRGSGAP